MIQAVILDREDDPDWLFRQCRRISKALAGGEIALAQLYAMGMPVTDFDCRQLGQLAATARFVKANFNPDQPRDERGRWTNQGSNRGGMSLPAAPAMRPRSNTDVAVPRNTEPGAVQLAADNQRQNKMMRDVVVQLRLTKDQRQELHRAISGQGLTYQEILDLAKDMFNK